MLPTSLKAVVSVLFLCTPLPTNKACLPYGPRGHRMVGAIADELLVDEPVYKQVRKLLGGLTLAEAATLPDEIKSWDKKAPGEPGAYEAPNSKLQTALEAFWRANPPSAPEGQPNHHVFHYTDVEVAIPRKYKDAKVGTSEFDIVHMISFCAKVLNGTESGKNKFKITKTVALVLLAHYLGDIHQPLHVGAEYFTKSGVADPDTVQDAFGDQGGNTIMVSLDVDDHGHKTHTHLHSFWDGNAVTKAMAFVRADMEAVGVDDLHDTSIASWLATKKPINWVAPTGPVDSWAEAWADEILPVAREAHERLEFSQITITGSKHKLANCLAEEKAGTTDYATWSGEVVKDKIQRAGWRLAEIIRNTMAN